jgi:hypothetical protein
LGLAPGEDLAELELDDPDSSPAVGRVAELFGLVQERVQVVLVACQPGANVIIFEIFS